MANILSVQRHIDFGYHKVGIILGDTYAHYRPTSAAQPIAPAYFQRNTRAVFGVDPFFKFFKPADFASASRWYGAFEDQSTVLAGDYFVGPAGTFYVVLIERLVAIQVVWCNRIVDVGRPGDSLPDGQSSDYGGVATQVPVPIITGWPASVRQLGSGMKMRGTEMKLPSDSALGAYSIFLPNIPGGGGTEFQWNDIIADDLGRRYAVASLEQSQMGWRLSAEMWPT